MFSGTTATGEYGDWQDLHAPFSSFCADSLMTLNTQNTVYCGERRNIEILRY
jgi:hypothetical protein